MSTDYDPAGIPPIWALDMAADESGYTADSPWLKHTEWGFSALSFQALARRIWRTEQPPVDPMMDIVREAIARGNEAEGFRQSAICIREGMRECSVVASLAYLREQKADFSS